MLSVPDPGKQLLKKRKPSGEFPCQPRPSDESGVFDYFIPGDLLGHLLFPSGVGTEPAERGTQERQRGEETGLGSEIRG